MVEGEITQVAQIASATKQIFYSPPNTGVVISNLYRQVSFFHGRINTWLIVNDIQNVTEMLASLGNTGLVQMHCVWFFLKSINQPHKYKVDQYPWFLIVTDTAETVTSILKCGKKEK